MSDVLDDLREERRFVCLPFQVVLENKENVLGMDNNVDWNKFTAKFVNNSSFGLWYALYNGAWEMLGLARITYDKKGNVIVDDFYARSGFGEEMVDILFEYLRLNRCKIPELVNAVKFIYGNEERSFAE